MDASAGRKILSVLFTFSFSLSFSFSSVKGPLGVDGLPFMDDDFRPPILGRWNADPDPLSDPFSDGDSSRTLYPYRKSMIRISFIIEGMRKAYEYLGGGFLLFPKVPPNEAPKILRRSVPELLLLSLFFVRRVPLLMVSLSLSLSFSLDSAKVGETLVEGEAPSFE